MPDATAHPNPISTAYDDPAVLGLWDARFDAEADLVGAVLADPARGYPDGRGFGVDGDKIAGELCRTAWLACAAKAMGNQFVGVPDADRRAVCLLVRSFIAGEGEWSNDHDAPRLADIAYRFPFYTRAAVGRAAEKVLRIGTTLAELSAICRRYEELTAPWAGEAA